MEIQYRNPALPHNETLHNHPMLERQTGNTNIPKCNFFIRANFFQSPQLCVCTHTCVYGANRNVLWLIKLADCLLKKDEHETCFVMSFFGGGNAIVVVQLLNTDIGRDINSKTIFSWQEFKAELSSR